MIEITNALIVRYLRATGTAEDKILRVLALVAYRGINAAIDGDMCFRLGLCAAADQLKSNVENHYGWKSEAGNANREQIAQLLRAAGVVQATWEATRHA